MLLLGTGLRLFEENNRQILYRVNEVIDESGHHENIEDYRILLIQWLIEDPNWFYQMFPMPEEPNNTRFTSYFKDSGALQHQPDWYK